MQYFIDAVKGIRYFVDVCGDLDSIDPAPDTFSTETKIEDDEIPMQDAVQKCHEVARQIEAIG